MGEAVELVRRWLDGIGRDGAAESRADARLRRLVRDRRSAGFAMAVADRVARPDDSAVAAEQLRAVSRGRPAGFLGPADRVLLAAGAALAERLPGLVVPLARRRLRRLVGDLVVDRRDPGLGRHLRRLRQEGFEVNVNLLGETVLGDQEATRRRRQIIELLGRPDVDYVSVKASSVAAQLNLWSYRHTLDRVKAGLRPILQAAARRRPPVFVNLDMEEYRDLRLTLDAFMALLDEPDLRPLEAGIVLQAYLPDSFGALRDLTEWALRRRGCGGAPVKVRLVKGANLAMERVEAALHGWNPAPYDTKAETDAGYLRLVDWALDPRHIDAVRVGIASHNLFDVAWAHLLAVARGVTAAVTFEMLHGMAPAVARAVRDTTGGVRLYVPVVDPDDFDAGLAYLSRRLEESSAPESFLRHLFDLGRDQAAFDAERCRFEASVADRWLVAAEPRRPHPRPRPLGFANVPDTDPTDPGAREPILAAVATPPVHAPPPMADVAMVDAVVADANKAADHWRRVPSVERRRILLRVAAALAARRPHLIASMVHEGAKTVGEADVEVSEAVDFATYYAEQLGAATQGDGARFTPLGTVLVVPPWNFPLAIPVGGALAALAAGNAAVVKPAPATPQTALAALEACWAAGVPRDALQYVRCADGAVGEHLVSHPGVTGIVLTGSVETADLFRRIAPDTPLFAETSGKNAVVVMPDADLDLAVADLVRSAFGHGGQKCSAASLAICVGPVATSHRFRRKLVDATRSLAVGPAADPASLMGPLIGEPPPKLARALGTLAPGESWLVQPALLDARTHLWSPGVIDGVAPDSWFHLTECFGPVLGLVAAVDLDDAIRIQNRSTYGLTGGIHSLDPEHQRYWMERVEVGNAYVNRPTTGAVVQRQPFGGWKRSVVGPGAKAGGPNYLRQLGRWHDDGLPALGRDPDPAVTRLVASFDGLLEPGDRTRLEAAARSDAYWWAEEFSVAHDPAALFCESNVFRYRPLPLLPVRIARDAAVLQVARVLVAALRSGSPLSVSVDPAVGALPAHVARVVEPGARFWERVAGSGAERVRIVGHDAPPTAPDGTFVDDRPPVLDGRIELLRYLREQTVSRTLHRFGILVVDREDSLSRPG